MGINKIDKGLYVVLGIVAAFAVAIVCTPAGAVDPAKFFGMPQPSAAPSCVAGSGGYYQDPNGCQYACAGAKSVILARPLSNSCAFSTTGPTATISPTPTVTVTPTPTATLTPTPTVTSTP